MNISNKKIEIIATFPKNDDLVCIVCHINNDIFYKNFNPFNYQILICRLIITTVRCCIASPDPNSQQAIFVIVSQKFFRSDRLQKVLENFEVEHSEPMPVDSELYNKCLKYNITFKLAPYWNLVAKNYYIKGFDFLMNSDTLEAVTWDMSIGDTSKIIIKPFMIQPFPLLVTKLPIPFKIIDNFLNNPNSTKNSIDLTLFGEIFAFVLPSMKKVRLLSVSKFLPKDSAFENYSDLRSHWKNMYSYRLPRNEAAVIYYEVVFPRFNKNKFVYPDVCLRAKQSEFISCINDVEIASHFVKDLTNSVRSICGSLVTFSHIYPSLVIKYSETRVLDVITNRKFSTPSRPSKAPPIVLPVNHKPDLRGVFQKNRQKRLQLKMLPQNVDPQVMQANKRLAKRSSNVLSYIDLDNEVDSDEEENWNTYQTASNLDLPNVTLERNENTLKNEVTWDASRTENNFDVEAKFVDESKTLSNLDNQELHFDDFPSNNDKTLSDFDPNSQTQVLTGPKVKSVMNVNLDLNRFKKLKPSQPEKLEFSSKQENVESDIADLMDGDSILSPSLILNPKRRNRKKENDRELVTKVASQYTNTQPLTLELWKNEGFNYQNSLNETQSLDIELASSAMIMQRFKEVGLKIFNNLSQSDSFMQSSSSETNRNYDIFKQTLNECKTRNSLENTQMTIEELSEQQNIISGPETQNMVQNQSFLNQSESLLLGTGTDVSTSNLTNSVIKSENYGFFQAAVEESLTL